jgi:transposase
MKIFSEYIVKLTESMKVIRKAIDAAGGGAEREGQASGELAPIFEAPRSKVSEWVQRYQTDDVDGLLEGYWSGRPAELTEEQQQQLVDIVDSGPLAYGLDNGIWRSPMIAWVIEEEFGVQYHPGHVRDLHRRSKKFAMLRSINWTTYNFGGDLSALSRSAN